MHVIERAFQLADTDRACLHVSDIMSALGREGYSAGVRTHFEGGELKKQLRSRIALRVAALGKEGAPDSQIAVPASADSRI